MAKKVKTTTTLAVIPQETQEQKRLQKEAKEDKVFEVANCKYTTSMNKAWQKYFAALTEDLKDNPKKSTKKASYTLQYIEDRERTLKEWIDFFGGDFIVSDD
jgi:formate dehydrogenase maturation protein FdhE